MRILLLGSLTLIILFACTKNATNNPAAPRQNVAPKTVVPDSNGNITAKSGDTLEIKILNPGYDGAYTWHVTSNFDSSIAIYESYKLESANCKGDTFDSTTGRWIIFAGCAAYEIWRYNILSVGQSTIELKWYRSFEPDSIMGSKTFSLLVE